MKSNRKFYVAEIRTSRHFGGHEEGGWWYDWSDVEAVHVRTSRPAARRLARQLADDAARYAPRWNRFSVLGGADTEIRVTRDPDEIESWQTRRRPRYE